MFRIIRVPVILDKFFCPLRSHFRWNHWLYFLWVPIIHHTEKS